MKTTLIAGIALIVLGAFVLGYGHYSYTTTEEVLKIGSLSATAERTHTIWLSPILGWLLVAGGAGLLIFGARSK